MTLCCHCCCTRLASSSPASSSCACSASLSTDGKSAGVGKVFWSGIVVAHDRCDHCKEYVAKTEHAVDVNYQVTL
jgi:hypothetical protein